MKRHNEQGWTFLQPHYDEFQACQPVKLYPLIGSHSEHRLQSTVRLKYEMKLADAFIGLKFEIG